MKYTVGCALLPLVLGLIVPSSQAQAQEASANERAMARREFSAGVAAAKEHRWQEAKEAFTRAYALAPRPLILLNLAGAQVHTGTLVEAAESYRRFLQDATEGRAARQRDAAQAALEAVEARIAQIRIRIAGLRAGDRIDIDGRELSRAAIGASLPLDPGSHQLSVYRGARRLAAEEIVLAEADVREVQLTVPVEPLRRSRPNLRVNSGAVTTNAGIERDRTADANDRSSGTVWSSPWFWTVVGVAVVGGAIAGYALLSVEEPSPYAGNFPPGHVAVR